MPDRPTVFIALPAYGQTVMSTTCSSLLGLSLALTGAGSYGGFATLSYPDIVEIRNIFLTYWYDRIQSSHMLFVDADMGFDPQLVMDMLAFDKPLVGALCPKKKLPIEFAGRAKPGECQIVNGHMEVNGVGGALTLISRDVVTAMLERYPELDDRVTIKNHAAKTLLDEQGVTRLIRGFDPLVVNGEKFSEDLSFCLRWKECGGEVWANIVHPVTHVGLYEYRGALFDSIKHNIRPLGAPAPAVSMPAVLPSVMPRSAPIAA